MPKYIRDTEYAKLRSALVPEAEKFANDTQGKTRRGSGRSNDQWCAAWNATFHAKMEELAKERIGRNG